MITKQLIRSNPKLSGNIRLVVSNSDKLYIETMDVDGLNDTRYKNVQIDPNSSFCSDLYRIFTKTLSAPSNQIFKVDKKYDDTKVQGEYRNQYETTYIAGASTNRDRYYNERFRISAPIWLGDTIPGRFIIFKIDSVYFNNDAARVNPQVLITGNIYTVNAEDGYAVYAGKIYNNGDTIIATDDVLYSLSGDAAIVDTTLPNISDTFLKDFISPSSIVASFDLGVTSNIGKYIRTHVNDINYKSDDIYVDWDAKTIEYYGIDYTRGVITSSLESIAQFVDNDTPVTAFDKYITDGFERHNLINLHAINLEFLFDDDDNQMNMCRYYGMYVNETDMATFYPVSQSQNEIHIKKDSLLPSEAVISIDDTKKITGIIPPIIKSYNSSSKKQDIIISTSVKNLFLQKLGAFDISFNTSFDISQSAAIGKVPSGNTYVLDNDATIASINISHYIATLYMSFEEAKDNLPFDVVNSDKAAFEYMRIVPAADLPDVAALKCSTILDIAIATLSYINNSTSANLSDITKVAILLRNPATGTPSALYPIVGINQGILVDMKVPLYEIKKDYVTTCSYYYIRTIDKLMKVNNTASDEDIIDGDYIRLVNVADDAQYRIIDYIYDMVSYSTVKLTINDLESYTVSYIGPLSMQSLLDAINTNPAVKHPVYINSGQHVKVTINGSTDLEFNTVEHKNYQTKLVLNSTHLTERQLLNFRDVQITGSVPTNGGRAYGKISVASAYENGDQIRILKGGRLLFQVIADELDHDFTGDNFRQYFYPYGTLPQVASAIAKALNYQFENFNEPFRAYNFDGDVYVICNEEGEIYNKYAFNIVSDTPNANNTTIFTGGTNNNSNRIVVDSIPTIDDGTYVVCTSTYRRVISISEYIDDVDTNTDSVSGKFVITFEPGERAQVYEGSIFLVQREPLTFGVFDVVDIADFDMDTYSSIYGRSYNIEYFKYYHTLRLQIGQEYIVKKLDYDNVPVSVNHNNVTYLYNQTFTAVSEDYKILSGSPIVLNVKYVDDKELISFIGFNNISRLQNESTTVVTNSNTITNKEPLLFDNVGTNEYRKCNENDLIDNFLQSKVVPHVCKFVLNNAVDVRNNPYRINASSSFGEMNFTPSFYDLEPNPQFFTHEFYYLASHPENLQLTDFSKEPSYFHTPFSPVELARTDVDYFSQYFIYKYAILDSDFTKMSIVPTQHRYSTIRTVNREGGKNVGITIFRGVKLKFTSIENLDGYKYSCILVLKKTDIIKDKENVSYETIVNSTFKNITTIITANIDDYKVTGNDKVYGEYSYLYMMESLRTYEQYEGKFYDGLLIKLPKIPNVNMVNPSGATISTIYGTKLYIKALDYFDTNIEFSQEVSLGDQYRLDPSGTHARLFAMDNQNALISTQQNGYIESGKYRIDMPTTIKTVGSNRLSLDTNGVFVLSLPSISSGINTSPSILSSNYNLEGMIWVNENGGHGYYRDIRRRLSFGYINKVNKENNALSTKDVKIEFLSPDKITKNNTLSVTSIPRNLEGNPSIVAKVPELVTVEKKFDMWRYSGGGTVLLKDLVQFNSFSYRMNIGSVDEPVGTSSKILDSFSLQTKLVNKITGEEMDYMLYDITPVITVGSYAVNGYVLNGNVVFDVSTDMGKLVNQWVHKISNTNILDTTNPVYYSIGQTAIDKVDGNIFYSQFDRRYRKYEKNSHTDVIGLSNPQLDKNFMGSIILGLPISLENASWNYRIMTNEADFAAGDPSGNDMIVYTDKNATRFKFDKYDIISFIISARVKDLLTPYYNSVHIGKTLDEYTADFIKFNVIPHFTTDEIGMLTKKAENLTFVSGDIQDMESVRYVRNSEISVNRDNDVYIVSRKVQNEKLAPYIIFKP
jgi:hypothetical protein